MNKLEEKLKARIKELEGKLKETEDSRDDRYWFFLVILCIVLLW